MYPPAGDQPLKDPGENLSSDRKRQRGRQDPFPRPAVSKPLPPRMTARQSPGAPRPRGLAVGPTGFSGAPGRTDRRSLPSAGPPGGQRDRAGPGLRAQVRGAATPCGHRHGHSADHRPRPPPVARPPAQEAGPRPPLPAEAPLQPLGPTLPVSGCMMGNVVRRARPPAVPGAGRRASRAPARRDLGGAVSPRPARLLLRPVRPPRPRPASSESRSRVDQRPRPPRLEAYVQGEEGTLALVTSPPVGGPGAWRAL